MSRFLPLLLALAFAGCIRPLSLVTRNQLTIDQPVVTQSKVALELSPTHGDGPVLPMPVSGGEAGCHAPRVAILDVDGLLLNSDASGPYSWGENPVSLFREKLDAIAADARVGAVVVRINSPGGSVTATDIMWRDLQAFRSATGKPVVACLMDVGTGGAYYLATASDRIIAHPTTITGGIGVILNLYNLREVMAQFNVLPQLIKAGANIDLGTSVAALTPDARKLLQTMADEFHARFREVVERARPNIDAAEDSTFDGRVFTARQALDRHLIDQIGYLDDAVAFAKQLAHLDQAQVVVFHRCNDSAHSPYAMTPNVPLQSTWSPFSVPGLERSRLPTFLYLWQPEATLEKLAGK